MKRPIPFSKYAGSGNDFIFIDNRAGCLPASIPKIFARLCDRKRGIGADGVILVEPSTSADFKMRIFNADGGEADMCGNGARCLYPYLHEIGLPQTQYHIETLKSHIRLRSEEGTVCVSMPDPFDFHGPITLDIDRHSLDFYFLNTGVPHVVCFVSGLKDPKWMEMAPKIRYHARFQPSGVNVNFVEMEASGPLHVRTYERGVEAETLSCGTGSTAAGLVMARLYNLPPPIAILPASNEILKIHFKKKIVDFSQVELFGPAEFIFKGSVYLD